MRSTSDIPPKCKDIRNSYISPDWNDMRSIADMNEINKISALTLRNFAYLADMRFAIAHPNCFATSHILCAVVRNARASF